MHENLSARVCGFAARGERVCALTFGRCAVATALHGRRKSIRLGLSAGGDGAAGGEAGRGCTAQQ
jgi:hypothetical protein